jgi:hypothetical protein
MKRYADTPIADIVLFWEGRKEIGMMSNIFYGSSAIVLVNPGAGTGSL